MYEVAVNAPIDPLTYGGGEFKDTLRLGQSILVPLGARKIPGVVLRQLDSATAIDFKLKNILDIDPDRPALSEVYLKWITWLANFYCYPLGQTIANSFPPLKKNSNRKSKKKPIVPNYDMAQLPPTLTPEQFSCLEAIEKVSGFSTHLVFGVTGSGKTEIYLRLIEKVIEQGKSALFLLPEISLTPQLVDRFSKRFPGKIAVLHSQLTPREKTDQWWQAYTNEKPIIIGARSALFCPIKNYGLIVVDEEHEQSFKQDEKLKYHARDAAVMLGRFHNCPVILGSATPSLESYNNALLGKYHLHTLKKRVGMRHLPEFAVVDMREEREKRKLEKSSELPFWLSQTLFDKISFALKQKHQVALFLNRRGMAQNIHCNACGYVFECPNCAISLTLHGKAYLNCHYCDYSLQLKEHCPQCHEPCVEAIGIGTERVDEDMKVLFPEARLARADRDEVQSREEMEQLVQDFENRHIDILVGTQMIAKGLDFPGLTVVGLVMADVALNMPDFRTSERSFQLITQVAGRAGRHSDDPGQVVIQTYNPKHLAIQHSIKNDYKGFANQELQFRKELQYPPYGKMALIRVKGNQLEAVESCMEMLSQRAQALSKTHFNYLNLNLLGPCPSPISRVRGKFRYQFMIKSVDLVTLQNFCKQLFADQRWLTAGTKLSIDMDPYNML